MAMGTYGGYSRFTDSIRKLMGIGHHFNHEIHSEYGTSCQEHPVCALLEASENFLVSILILFMGS